MSENVLVVDTPEALDSLLPQLAAAPRIALDVESCGMHAWKATLCTAQVAWEAEGAVRVAVIDTRALDADSLARLRPLFGSEGPLKLLHDLTFDAELLATVGIALGNVGDTQIAARFLGIQQVGLGSLAQSRLGKVLSKALQNHDWRRRPFTPEQLDYLSGDVVTLFPLADSLAPEIEKLGLGEAVAFEAAYRSGESQARAAQADRRPPWVRVKREGAWSPGELAILRELAALREQWAEKLDVPPFKVLEPSLLVELAQKPPKSMAELSAHRLLQRGRGQTLLPRIAEAIRLGTAAGDVPPDERAEWLTTAPRASRAEHDLRKARERALTQWRSAEAAKRGVDPQAVLPGHALQALLDAAPTTPGLLLSVPGLGAFRATRDGAALLAPFIGGPRSDLLPDGAGAAGGSGGGAAGPRIE